MSSPVYDGGATGQSTNANATCSLTTTSGNDIIIVYAYNEALSTGGVAVASVTASGLTFAHRATSNGSTHGSLELWWALASSPLTSEVITVAWSGTFDDSVIVAQGFSGANTVSPFDPNGSLTAKVSGAIIVPGVSTTDAPDLLLSAQCCFFGGLTAPSGWTGRDQIGNGGGVEAATIVTATNPAATPQSNITVTWTGSPFGTGTETIVDALISGAAAPPSKGFFHNGFSSLAFPSPGLVAAMAGISAIKKNKIMTRRGLIGIG